MSEDDQKTFHSQFQTLSTKPSLRCTYRNSRNRSSSRSSRLSSRMGSARKLWYNRGNTMREGISNKQNIENEYGLGIVSTCVSPSQIKLLKKISFLKSEISDVQGSLTIYLKQQQGLTEYLQFMDAYIQGKQPQVEYVPGYSDYGYFNELQQLKIVRGQIRKRDITCLEIKNKMKQQIEQCRKEMKQNRGRIEKINKDIYSSYIYSNRSRSLSSLSGLTRNTRVLGNKQNMKCMNCRRKGREKPTQILLLQSVNKMIGIQLCSMGEYRSEDSPRSRIQFPRQVAISLKQVRKMTAFYNKRLITGVLVQSTNQLVSVGRPASNKAQISLSQGERIEDITVYEIDGSPSCIQISTTRV